MDKIFTVWMILLGLSLFAFLIGFFDIKSGLFVGILLLSTFVKGFFVIENFMGLSKVKVKYRIIPTVWLGTVMTVITITYYA